MRVLVTGGLGFIGRPARLVFASTGAVYGDPTVTPVPRTRRHCRPARTGPSPTSATRTSPTSRTSPRPSAWAGARDPGPDAHLQRGQRRGRQRPPGARHDRGGHRPRGDPGPASPSARAAGPRRRQQPGPPGAALGRAALLDRADHPPAEGSSRCNVAAAPAFVATLFGMALLCIASVAAGVTRLDGRPAAVPP